VTRPGPAGKARGFGTFLTLIKGGVVAFPGEALAQVGTVMVSVSVVMVPLKANALPDQVVFAPTVIPASPMTVPKKVVFAASVVAALGVQNTSQAEAPFKVITAPAVEVSAPTALKM